MTRLREGCSELQPNQSTLTAFSHPGLRVFMFYAISCRFVITCLCLGNTVCLEIKSHIVIQCLLSEANQIYVTFFLLGIAYFLKKKIQLFVSWWTFKCTPFLLTNAWPGQGHFIFAIDTKGFPL